MSEREKRADRLRIVWRKIVGGMGGDGAWSDVDSEYKMAWLAVYDESLKLAAERERDEQLDAQLVARSGMPATPEDDQLVGMAVSHKAGITTAYLLESYYVPIGRAAREKLEELGWLRIPQPQAQREKVAHGK